MSASGHTNSTTTAMYQQEVTSMAMQLHGFFFGLLELPSDILSSWRWQLQSATCAELLEIPWALEELRQPKLSDGLNTCAKYKTDNSYT